MLSHLTHFALFVLLCIVSCSSPVPSVAGQSPSPQQVANQAGAANPWFFDLIDRGDGQWQLMVCYQGVIDDAMMVKTEENAYPILFVPMRIGKNQHGECVVLLYHISAVHDLYLNLDLEGVDEDVVIDVRETMKLNNVKVPAQPRSI